MDLIVIKTFLAVHGRAPIFDALAMFGAAVLPYALTLGFIIAGFTLIPRNRARPLTSGKQRLYYLLTTALALLMGRGIIVPVARFLYPVARPFVTLNFTPLITHAADDPSFPSGHAVVLFTLAAALWPIHKRAGWYMIIGAAVNGAARVYVGVHWPSDIIVGAIIGIVVMLAARRLAPQP